MLRKIISITGKPGLYKIISSGKGSLIVEELGSGRRFAASARDRIVSLGDISMYTESGDTPLGEILDKTYAKFEGKPLDIKVLEKNNALRDTFGEIVEDFDRERVHNSDIKKLFSWYNILIANGFKEFAEKKEETSEEAPAEEK